MTPDRYVQQLRAVASAIAPCLDNQDYYQLLGLHRQARAPEISAAFHKAASHLHPDRVKRYADEELAGQIETIFARISEGHRVLSRPASRADYDQALAQGQKRHSFKQNRGIQARRTPLKHPQAKKILSTWSHLFGFR